MELERHKQSTHIKRPTNAYQLYCTKHRNEIKEENPGMPYMDVTYILLKRWRYSSADEKAPFVAEAEKLKELHMQKHPDFKYPSKKSKCKTHVAPAPKPSKSDESLESKLMSGSLALGRAPTQMTPVGMNMKTTQPAMSNNAGYSVGNYPSYLFHHLPSNQIFNPPIQNQYFNPNQNLNSNHYHHPHQHFWNGNHGNLQIDQPQYNLRPHSVGSSGSTSTDESVRSSHSPNFSEISLMTPPSFVTATSNNSENNNYEDITKINPTVFLCSDFPWDDALKSIDVPFFQPGR